MRVMIRVVVVKPLKRMPRQHEFIVIFARLGGREREQQDGTTCGEPGDRVSDGGTERVEKEAFHGVVVKRTKGVRDLESVVDCVEARVQKLVFMHETMCGVLQKKGRDDQRLQSRSRRFWIGGSPAKHR